MFIRYATSGTRNSNKTGDVSLSSYCQLSLYISYQEQVSFLLLLRADVQLVTRSCQQQESELFVTFYVKLPVGYSSSF
jgi:hypothetical protein